MKVLVFIGLCLCLLNCEDKKSISKDKTSTKDSISISKNNTPKKDTITTQKREFPLLTEDNAMEFFLEYEKHHKENKVRMTTDFGIIDILLFDKTKFHRANFIFLTKQNYFDNSQFHRVSKNFIIQGGNGDDIRLAKKRRAIGRYLLPTDTKRGYSHSRGVISMPSSELENPHKLASPYEFFIVQRDAFHLDGDYTIFGKVIRGMDIVDKIAAQETDSAEWPLNNIYIKKVEIIE